MRARAPARPGRQRSEEHTSELQSHSEISYAVFCLQKEMVETWPVAAVAVSGISRAVPDRGWAIQRSWNALYGSHFFLNDTATTEIYTLSYTLSLHDALPI